MNSTIGVLLSAFTDEEMNFSPGECSGSGLKHDTESGQRGEQYIAPPEWAGRVLKP